MDTDYIFSLSHLFIHARTIWNSYNMFKLFMAVFFFFFNLWVMTCLGVEWSIYWGHIQPSENKYMYLTIHNSNIYNHKVALIIISWLVDDKERKYTKGI